MSKTVKVLIVEDEVLVARNIRQRLLDWGYEVTALATAGEEALQIIPETPPDVVLMDIQLSGMLNGVETAETIRTRFDIPVVYLTAYTEDPVLQSAKATEPFGYLLKPFRDQELRTTIEMALYKHAQEQRLRESEQRYRVVSELSSDFAFSIKIEADGSLVTEWVTDSFMRLTGYSEKTLRQMDWKMLVYSADQTTAEAYLRQIRAGNSGGCDLRILGQSGEWRWVNFQVRPEWDTGQTHVVRFYGAGHDITERMLAQQALQQANAELELRVEQRTAELQQAEEKYHQIFDQASEGILQTTPDGKLVTANPALARIFGYASPSEMIAEVQDVGAQLYANARDRVALSNQLESKGLVHGYVFQARRKDDQIIWVSANAHLAKAKNGERLYEGMLEDITERVQAEQAQQKSEERYRAVSELTSDYAYAFRVEPNGTLTCEWVTDAFERITGFTPNEIEACDGWDSLVHPEDQPILQQRAGAIAIGQSHISVFRIVTKNQNVRWLRDYVRPIWDEKRQLTAYLCGAAQDITEQVLAQQALQEAHDQLEARVADRTQALETVNQALRHEIAGRQQAQTALAREASVNAAMASLSAALISSTSLDEISALILDYAKQLTGSTFGFVGYIESSTGYLVSTTLTRDIWDTCQVPDKSFVFKHFDGLFGWVLKNHQALLTNAPSSDPRAVGTPSGHIPIQQFVSAPAMLGSELVGQIALANPGRDYTAADQAIAERLASLYALAVHQNRTMLALQNSEERYRLLFNGSNDAVFVSYFDPKSGLGQFVEVNNVACQQLDYTKEELLQRTLADIRIPEDTKSYMARMGKLAIGTPVMFETIHVAKNGQQIPVEIHSRLFDLGGRPAVLSVARDISERVQAEERLRLQSTALSAAANAIVITDVSGAILWANPAFTQLTGYSLEEATGANPRILKSGQMTRRTYQHLWKTIMAGKTWQGALVNRRKDGSLYHEEMVITPVRNTAEEITHFIAIKQDVTSRIEAEEALRRYANEQAALYAVTSAATLFLDPDELLTNVVDTLLARLGIDAGWVLLPGKMPDAPAHLTAARGISDGFAAAEQVHHLGACARCAALLARQEPANKPSKITECPILPADILEASGLHSYISLPMEVGQRVLGIMHLGWREAHAYTREEHSLLLNIGRQTALALRNAQLYQTALQVDRLQTINAIGVAASSSLELETVLRQVLQMACQALDASEGSILLHEPETGELVFTLSIGRSTTLQGQRIPAGKGLAGWVVEHAQVARVNNVRLDERWYPYPDEVSGFETHSLLCAPLIYHERVTGVIEIVNKRRSEFSEEDAGLIEAVSSIAAVALENARLYTTTRTRAEELKLLYEIGIALTRSLDYNMVVDDALARVQRLFQAKYVSLLQPDPQTGELIFIKALAGAEPVTIPLRLKSGEGLAGWVYEHREVILTNDAQTDPRFSGRADRLTGLQTRSLMAVPLLTGGSVTGIIEVISERPAAYSADDLRTLQSLTSTLAVALDNARLYEDLKRLLIERERAHAQLIQSEKISALGRLAASVAHEINNPLQAVQGCLTLFGEEMAGQQRQDKMGRYLHTVESEIERIAAIVRRMRDFYRPAREGLSSVNVVEVLESVLELAAKQLQHSEVEVRRDWEIEIPAIQANPDHLKQVFLNLIINAIDAMPQGGELRLSVSATHQPPENSPLARPHVRIEFSDTGHGMSPETTDQVFEPFFTTKDQGSGLGLYISYGIIKSLAGDITVHSQLGQGTTFTIFLPIKLD